MSGLSAPLRTPASGPVDESRPLSLSPFTLHLIAFGGLAAFGSAHWAMLVEDAPAGRTLLVLLIALGSAGLLGLLRAASARRALPPAAAHGLAGLIFLATLALGLMAAGLPGKLLLPGHWPELVDGLDRGLAGVQGVDWPYAGPDEWIRRTILLGAPAFLAIAAALAFWPAHGIRRLRRGPARGLAQRGRVLRAGALVVLLLFYGTAVTEHDPGEPLLRGLVLLLFVAAWLWLPRVPAREAALGAAAVVAVGMFSLPVAAALDGDRPWWDYRAWQWFGGGETVVFDWTHEYGPLDWPRDGTTVLNVQSDRPHYWKAETLDRFDGLRWTRSPGADLVETGPEVAYVRRDPTRRPWDYHDYNPRWDEEIRFTVRSLTSDLVVSAGTTLEVRDVAAQPTPDGTTRLLNGQLEEGDSYTVETYAPNPTRAQMQQAPEGYPGILAPYTAIYLPGPGETAIDGVGLRGDAARTEALEEAVPLYPPLRGRPDPEQQAAVERALLDSPYARMFHRAQELTAGQPTVYGAVKRVETHLQRNYRYSERVPTRPYPLPGFLFEDRRGYCQQFSGAMALMLRMAGIPSRVAAGFAPGTRDNDTGEFRVRDLDAHSWVEVWFTGIGWVPFDPTPAASPAGSQSSFLATSAAAADAGEAIGIRRGLRDSAPTAPAGEAMGIRRGLADSAPSADTGVFGAPEEGRNWLPAVLILFVGLPLAAGAAYLTLRVRHLHALGPDELAEAQLAELRKALTRLDWDLPASTTLLGLERRLDRFAGPASAAYARGLRVNRYDPRAPAAPGLGDRRAVRRELSRGSLRDRLRGLLALPPGVPRS